MNKSKESAGTNNDYKYDIPQICIQTFLKNCKVEKMHKKFTLIVNPKPIIEGELLLF